MFHYEENEITVIKCRDDIWFKGRDVARSLGYEETRNAILRHVEDEDKTTLEVLKRGAPVSGPPEHGQAVTIFINESGLYCLIFGSKLESAKAFK